MLSLALAGVFGEYTKLRAIKDLLPNISWAPVRLLRADNPKVKFCIRLLMFVLAAAIACPVRYWAIAEDFDNNWAFGLNYAAAQGLAHGRDVLFTTGPLGHLVFAQDVGDNLVHAIRFQAVVWAVMIGVLWDLYFRAGVPLRNLCLFTVFWGLAAPLFWFNRIGIDNLLLAGALVYLAVYRRQGGIWRLLVTLTLIGLMPLIKLTSGMIALGALAGFLVDRIIQRGWNAWRDVVLVVAIPALVAGIGFYLTIPSFADFVTFVRVGLEISSGYSAAMSNPGPGIELLAAVEVLALVGALLLIQAPVNRIPSLFWMLLLALPLAISFKHGFVRQDYHVLNFFCFCSLALALVSLSSYLHGRYLPAAAAVLVPFLVIWQDHVMPQLGLRTGLETITGVRGLRLAWNAKNLNDVKAALSAESELNNSPYLRVEPEVREAIGDAPVASMSLAYSHAVVLDKLRFVVYPLIARAAAYTPYLDELSAAWVRDKGPRFIIFDGSRIDNRHPWTETPAMWLEVYRWYDTRLLGKYNLLLERRTQPRFSRLASLGRFTIHLHAGFSVPPSQDAMFWSMSCHLSREGKLRKLFFRLPALIMQTQDREGTQRQFRVLADVLVHPSLGSTLPADLPQFANLFRADSHPKQTVQYLSFGTSFAPKQLAGTEVHSYEPTCEVEFFKPST
jgi:hypothetical protein